MDKQQSESDVAFLRQQKSNHRFDTEGARECNERNPAAGAIFILKKNGNATFLASLLIGNKAFPEETPERRAVDDIIVLQEAFFALPIFFVRCLYFF